MGVKKQEERGAERIRGEEEGKKEEEERRGMGERGE